MQCFAWTRNVNRKHQGTVPQCSKSFWDLALKAFPWYPRVRGQEPVIDEQNPKTVTLILGTWFPRRKNLNPPKNKSRKTHGLLGPPNIPTSPRKNLRLLQKLVKHALEEAEMVEPDAGTPVGEWEVGGQMDAKLRSTPD